MRLQPTLLAGLLSAAEMALHKALAYDPGSRQRLQALAGQTLALHSLSPEATVYLHLTEAGPELLQHYEGEVTTSLTGKAGDLARLVTHPGKTLHGTGVTLAGSTALLAELQAVMHNLDIDWEEALGELLGVVPAHTLSQAMRGAGNWARERQQSFVRLASEYLTEESGSVLGRREFEAFNADIHELRLALDRAEAQFETIKSALDRSAHKEP